MNDIKEEDLTRLALHLVSLRGIESDRVYVRAFCRAFQDELGVQVRPEELTEELQKWPAPNSIMVSGL